MVNAVNAMNAYPAVQRTYQLDVSMKVTSVSTGRSDHVQFGRSRVSDQEAMNIVAERAIEKLRAVVTDAREQLGIPEGAVSDTSPEATARRIPDFALGAFEHYRKNHPGLGEEEARQQFVDFIGGTISQGIEEARGIITALQALTPGVEDNINTTFDLIQERLNDFAANGK